MSKTEIEIFAEQIKFTDWLKSKGMYNIYESSSTMRKMFNVWSEMEKEILELEEQHDQDMAGENI